MSQVAELHLLKARIAELEDQVRDIDMGQSRAVEKLRDKIAIAAMQGMLANNWNRNYADWADHAYQMADAMLREKEKANEQG